MEERRRRGGSMVILGLLIAVASAIAFMWSVSYTSNFGNIASAGLSNLMGQSNPTFEMAKAVSNLAPIGFGAGLLVGIIGLVRR